MRRHCPLAVVVLSTLCLWHATVAANGESITPFLYQRGVTQTDSASGVLCYGRKAIPNLFMIGGQKCGSTTLWAYLVQDQFGKGFVYSKPKEIGFVNQHGLPREEWLDTYSKYFPDCTHPRIANASVRWVMDGTPNTLLSLQSPTLIHSTYKRHNAISNLKFMVILRDPIARTMSWFAHIGRKFLNVPCSVTFDDWAAEEVARVNACLAENQRMERAALYARCHSGLLGSWYGLQLRSWFHLFPPSASVDPSPRPADSPLASQRWLIIDFEDLSNEPDLILQKVFSFLAIPFTLPLPSTHEHRNTRDKHQFCPAPSISSATRELLHNFFKPTMLELKELFAKYGLSDSLPKFVGRAERGEFEGSSESTHHD
eukprot:jgi/Chlat1/1016/Chrsp109S01445